MIKKYESKCFLTRKKGNKDKKDKDKHVQPKISKQRTVGKASPEDQGKNAWARIEGTRRSTDRDVAHEKREARHNDVVADAHKKHERQNTKDAQEKHGCKSKDDIL